MTRDTPSAAFAAARFEEITGRTPDGVWAAPGRVNLIGEHTDYNEGFVLPFAIDRHTWAAISLRSDGIANVTSGYAAAANGTSVNGTAENEPSAASAIDLGTLTADQLSGWSAYPLGVAWAIGEHLQQTGHDASLATLPGFDLHLESDVPVGAGLSSSAAIECATAVALNDLWNLGLDRRTLARIGQRAENVAVGAPTGIMDQSASLLGQTDHAVFLDCRSLESSAVPLGLAESGLEVLVIDTTVSHAHSTGGYASRRASCERGAEALGHTSLRDVSVDDLQQASTVLDDETFRRVRHVVTENQRVLDTVKLLNTEGAAAIGPLLDASHLSMRDDFEISIPELDLAVTESRQAGAIGSRMTGGGFGGAAIAIIPSALRASITDAVLTAFAREGFAQPHIFAVTAGAGASRAL